MRSPLATRRARQQRAEVEAAETEAQRLADVAGRLANENARWVG